ncbi:HesA/MoeB/ThiF family protein [Mesorhizobium sp. ANAO-SY3R2]|uniref:HesA/MoeB/ThiF family protein n=1 Tax=Mesorhizobium sp. ANAO-SY3R2 TaxID=3166644 RepID=UPI00366FC09C
MIDSIPLPLQPLLDEIEVCPRTTLVQGWFRDNKCRWVLGFNACLSVSPSPFMPAESSWFLVVEDEPTRPKITIFPAADGGITCTFPHQSANLPGPAGSLWRLGNPCIERPEAAFKRDAVTGEPTDLAERLIWRVGRLLSWIDAAATEKLLEPGDHIELPSFDAALGTVLGFTETLDDLSNWSPQIGNWGYAVTGAISCAFRHRQVVRYLTASGNVFKEDGVDDGGADLPVDAVWVMLPRMPTIAPWQPPMTWRELSACLESDGVSLEEIFLQAGRQMRTLKRSSPSRLLLGFPLAQKVAYQPERIHWIAAENIGLSGATAKRNGFRPIENNRARWDATRATSMDRIKWIKTANWASDQLRTRGEAQDVVRSSRVLIVGAGAVGSAVAENLARLGVREFGVVDGDLMEIGNLSRHTLGMSDCGHSKAKAVAARLGNCAPDVSATPYLSAFPTSDIRIAEALRKYNVVIDCTGSDAVLQAMAEFDWQTEKLFVSLSIGWGAKEFFCFSVSEAAFPAVDALDRFASNMTFKPHMEAANREGIGCWHPVFPASADDIQLWGAIGSKYVRTAIVDRRRQCKIYRLMADATVTVIDA